MEPRTCRIKDSMLDQSKYAAGSAPGFENWCDWASRPDDDANRRMEMEGDGRLTQMCPFE